MLKKIGNTFLRRVIGIPSGVDGGGHRRAIKSCAAGRPGHRPEVLSKSECQRIVNDFGLAMADIANGGGAGANARHMAARDQTVSAGDDGRNRTTRFDRACLPHSPEMIREAVQTLLKYEKDRTNIETLQMGLAYLEYFE